MKELNCRKIVIGETFPDGPLHRFFDKDKYASAFFDGCIRFGWLKKYLKMEGDVREDSTEGTAQYTYDDPNQVSIIVDKNTGNEIDCIKRPGITNISSTSINEFYILSACAVIDKTNLIQLRKRFSKNSTLLPAFIIIDDVKKFTEIIAKAFEESEYCQYIMGLKWFEVEYTKGQNRSKHEPDLHLEVYQKPACVDGKDYSCEREWRLAVCFRDRGSLLGIQDASARMFLTGDDRLKRIANYVNMEVDELRNSSDLIYMYGDEVPLWIEHITINASPRIQSCTRLLK